MKTVFVGPREAVDLLIGRSVHHAVLTESGDWLVVAEIPSVQLRAEVLAAAGVAELPRPGSGAALPSAVVDSFAAATAAAVPVGEDAPVATAPPPVTTRDLVEQTVSRLGMPSLLALLDR